MAWFVKLTMRAVGVAGEIGEHGLGSGERSLGIDDPLDLAQWLEPIGEGFVLSQCLVLTEELQVAGVIGGTELLEK